MNSKDFLKEGFIEDASDVHMDHEVQMAREECYHAAEHALAIHKLLRNISEQQGLEGWVSSKITLANDYLNTVREHLEYELLQPQIDDVAMGIPIAESEQQGVAEGEVKTQKYEMMMRNGQVKKFVAKDDVDAKRIAKGHGAKSVIKMKGNVPGKKLKEQGISDEEIRQRIQPTFQATDAQINDPEWMRSRGLNTLQDIEADIKASDAQGNALNQAQKSGFPTYQHQGQTYGVMNPKYGKGGATGQPKPLTPQQVQQTVGTNIVSGTGAPVTAGSKMLTPNQRMGGVNETSAGSVAGVVNPKTSKSKNKIGSLFGGTYKQSQKKA